MAFRRTHPELDEIVVKVKRCCKVVKGGKRFSFSALVAVGNRKKMVGYGKGKANEVPQAVEKAVKFGRKNMVKIPMKDTTIPHRTEAKYGATRVLLRPACQGTGIIAGSSMRAILELAGIKDILGKVFGSTNPTNVLKATLIALQKLHSKKELEELRGGSVI
ncbi:MAG: 30S ribosomal protein S5 [Planctomycetes bacterium]|nr:30S ribosomal protein S5 [Planctomycetota bacterium]